MKQIILTLSLIFISSLSWAQNSTPNEEVHEIVPKKKVENGYTYIFDAHQPIDTSAGSFSPDPNSESWYWGTAPNGAKGSNGLVIAQRGARITITPQPDLQGVEGVDLTLYPCNTSGAVYGNNPDQYMDICVAMNNQTATGYGLRIAGSSEFNDAVAISIIKYTEGQTKHLTTPARCELLKPGCKIKLAIKSGTLNATLQHEKKKQTISSRIITNNLGREFLLQHTGNAGEDTILIEGININ